MHIEFNQTLLADLFFQGYKTFLYVNFGNHAVLKPLKVAVPDNAIDKVKLSQLNLMDFEIIEMSERVDVDFKFYVSEEYFNGGVK